jgi:hypothetical protein
VLLVVGTSCDQHAGRRLACLSLRSSLGPTPSDWVKPNGFAVVTASGGKRAYRGRLGKGVIGKMSSAASTDSHAIPPSLDVSGLRRLLCCRGQCVASGPMNRRHTLTPPTTIVPTI